MKELVYKRILVDDNVPQPPVGNHGGLGKVLVPRTWPQICPWGSLLPDQRGNQWGTTGELGQ